MDDPLGDICVLPLSAAPGWPSLGAELAQKSVLEKVPTLVSLCYTT